MNDDTQLIVGDQTVFFKSSENMNNIQSESVTLVVTSPPYWNVRDYGDEQIGYGQSYNEYISALNKVWKECIRVLQPNGKIAINVQPLPIDSKHSGFGRRIISNIMFDIEQFFRNTGCYLSGMHYWDKAPYISNVSWGSYPKPTNIASNTSFEQIFVFVKPGKTRKINPVNMEASVLKKEEWRHFAVRCIWDDISPVIKIDSKGVNRFGHSAPFPEEIPYRIIKMHSAVGETVLDPFLGSGTTLKICRILNRKGIGYETNRDYKNLIRERIEEEWDIPTIDTQYKTIGTSLFYEILLFIHNRITTNPTISLDELIKDLHRQFPKKITKSWIK
ncbi:MAG: site-specific DNA-methyltransferase, partial [Candidatus Heimdallarchaeota archaeon]|nr:site-specific DNA-methyltransferase [Candidatus Heimdallarchaeota archaeon]